MVFFQWKVAGLDPGFKTGKDTRKNTCTPIGLHRWQHEAEKNMWNRRWSKLNANLNSKNIELQSKKDTSRSLEYKDSYITS